MEFVMVTFLAGSAVVPTVAEALGDAEEEEDAAEEVQPHNSSRHNTPVKIFFTKDTSLSLCVI